MPTKKNEIQNQEKDIGAVAVLLERGLARIFVPLILSFELRLEGPCADYVSLG
jgi:hypothetical protein